MGLMHLVADMVSTEHIYSRFPLLFTHPLEAAWAPHTCQECTESHLDGAGQKVEDKVRAGSVW